MQRPYSILVIEDNEINRDILFEMFHGEYDMLFAVDGSEGMRMLREHYHHIDIVLLDIQMPVMNGYEVLEAMSADPLLKDIPVIVTTGNDGLQDEIRCLKSGATDFVRKPYAPSIVRLRINSIMHLRESKEANRQKTVFIQNISHELRTPMNAILGFSRILGDEAVSVSDADRRMYSSLIESNSHALMAMIDNMMLLSDSDSNNLSVKIEPLSVNKLCRMALKKTGYCHPEGVRVYFTSDFDDDVLVCTSSRLVQLVITNFLTNACKFTQVGEVRLHCGGSYRPGYVVVSVTDTGIGIPPDSEELLYARFEKLDYFVQGAGVGLSVCRTIAGVLGGNVFHDTAYTNGARFVFELPLKSDNENSHK